MNETQWRIFCNYKTTSIYFRETFLIRKTYFFNVSFTMFSYFYFCVREKECIFFSLKMISHKTCHVLWRISNIFMVNFSHYIYINFLIEYDSMCLRLSSPSLSDVICYKIYKIHGFVKNYYVLIFSQWSFHMVLLYLKKILKYIFYKYEREFLYNFLHGIRIPY